MNQLSEAAEGRRGATHVANEPPAPGRRAGHTEAKGGGEQPTPLRPKGPGGNPRGASAAEEKFEIRREETRHKSPNMRVHHKS